LVVGEREQADRSVALRRYGQTSQEALNLTAFEARIRHAIASRSLVD
jgi:threonyl-tRNA synthetase